MLTSVMEPETAPFFVPNQTQISIDGNRWKNSKLKVMIKKNCPWCGRCPFSKKSNNKDGTIRIKNLRMIWGHGTQEDVSGILVRQQDGTDAFMISQNLMSLMSTRIYPYCCGRHIITRYWTNSEHTCHPLTNWKPAQRIATSISLIGLALTKWSKRKPAKTWKKSTPRAAVGRETNPRHLERAILPMSSWEHAYQFRKKQVDAAHMMLSDETFTQIQITPNRRTTQMAELQKITNSPTPGQF